jgi:hypothetical protein
MMPAAPKRPMASGVMELGIEDVSTSFPLTSL